MLFLVLLFAQVSLLRSFRESILHGAEMRAQSLAAGAINGMNMLMVTGTVSNPELRRLYIRKMADAEDVTELRVIRAPQVQAQFGPGLPEEQPKDELDRLAIRTKATQVELGERLEPPTLRVVVPFIVSTNFRGTNCLQCHDVPVGSVNGAASITLDLSGDYARIDRTNRWLWVGQIALQTLLFVLASWLVNRVLRPLKRLEATMSRIGTSGTLPPGTTDQHAPQSDRLDEIGRLELAFRDMSSALTQKMRALEDTRRQLDVYLKSSNEDRARLLSLLSVMRIGVLFVSEDNRVIHANPRFFEMWDLDPAAFGADADALELLAAASAKIPGAAGNRLLQKAREASGTRRIEASTTANRTIRIERYRVDDQDVDASPWLWVFDDITEDRRNAEQLAFFAERDPLTGLYNRRRFQEDLDRAIAQARRTEGQVALLLLDLDGFKYVNDTFGHGAGDEILQRIASLLSATVRPSDLLYRWGGDEFTILVTNAAESDFTSLAKRIVSCISGLQLEHDKNPLCVTASVGASLFPADARDARELMSHADAAMYKAKTDGRNMYRAYDLRCDVSSEMLSRMSLESRIDDAVANGALRLHFQGVYRPDGGLAHLEALVRMVDPADAGKLLAPAKFIPLAESSGRIRAIDLWVVREVIGILSRSHPGLSIAVNVSGRSLDNTELANSIRSEIASKGVDPKRLILEVTETAAAESPHHLQRFTEAMRLLGCRICLDDFGSGFSSFAYLRHLDADILKIDGTFVQDLACDPRSQVLVRAIVAVARAMGKLTVAEFVESKAALDLLVDMGVDLAQGYLFDYPTADHPALDLLGYEHRIAVDSSRS